MSSPSQRRYIGDKAVDVLLMIFVDGIVALAVNLTKPFSSLSVSDFIVAVVLIGFTGLLVVVLVSPRFQRYLRATESSRVRAPTYALRIKDKRDEYRSGDYVFFYSRYQGRLRSGFFINKIQPPEGTTFSDGTHEQLSRAPQTGNPMSKRPTREGTLKGDKVHQASWSWKIPEGAPTGKYAVTMFVENLAQDFFISIENLPVAESRDTFLVVN
jgi:hypothetical protein